MRTPATIAAGLPSAWLILLAWVVGGVYSLLGAWSLSEVGAMIPSARCLLHNCPARLRRLHQLSGGLDRLDFCLRRAAFISLLAGEYLGDLVPILAGHTPALAAFIIAVLGLLQWRGIRWGSVFQNATSAITSCVFVVLIVAAFAHPHYRSSTLTPTAVMPAGIALLAAWVLVLQAVIGTYDGC